MNEKTELYDIVMDWGRGGVMRAYPIYHQPRMASWQYKGRTRGRNPADAIENAKRGVWIREQQELQV